MTNSLIFMPVVGVQQEVCCYNRFFNEKIAVAVINDYDHTIKMGITISQKVRRALTNYANKHNLKVRQ